MNSLNSRFGIFLVSIVALFLVCSGCNSDSVQEVDSAKAEANQPLPAEKVTTEDSNETVPINRDGKQPKLTFAELTHDFGKKMSGPDLKHTFTFKNDGDGTLFIEKVKAGWGCTAALVSSKEIPPGGEGKIDVTFKTQRRKGVNRKKITVTSNDPTNPRLQLEIVADLEQLLDASPRRQWFGRVKQEETITKTFTIEGKELESVEIKNIKLKAETNKAAYQWKVHDEKTEEGRKLTIDVSLNGSVIAPGRFNDILVVETNLTEAGTLELNLSGEILGPITTNPRRLYFGQYEMNREMVKTITLTANNDIPFKVLEASIEDKEFKIDPWNREAALEHTLTVRIVPKLERDRIRTGLKILTDMAKQPDVEIDIHAYKRRTRPGNPEMKKMDSGDVKKAVPVTDRERKMPDTRKKAFANKPSAEKK